ncbi:MAG: ABC transporter substrate-binding protein [Paracoccaceae bacterium]
MKRLAIATVAAVMAAAPVMADLVLPSLSFRTGPYAVGGIPLADGYADYFTMVNERDGGIGGVPVRILECETGYNTEKGVECYESTKGEGALLYQPFSTGITYQLIPKATADGIALHTMGYGRTSAANGKVFSNVFNFPANYWDAASVAINYLLDENNGDIKGRKIALLYHNSAYGKEPIRTLEKLSEKHGFELSLLAVDHPGQEQKSQWLQIRRERPDNVLMWGWGVMNQVAVQEAANVRYPMENFIGVWWSGAEADVIPAGAAANGYKALTMNGVGKNFPIYDDIQKYVVDGGKTAGAGDQIGTVLYSRTIYAGFLAHMAILKAQEIHGVADITQAMMVDGMENLEITNAMMEQYGVAGMGPEFTVSCENHGGPGLGAVTQWDASAGVWNLITDFKSSDKSIIDVLVEEDSMAFAAENNIDLRCN